MTRVVVTTADRDGWWWGGAGVLTGGGGLVTVTLPGFAGVDAFAVHESDVDLAARFTRDPYDFDGLAVECGFAAVPILSAVRKHAYCTVVRTTVTRDAVQVHGIPAALPLAA